MRRPGGLVRDLSPRGSSPQPELILEARPALDFLVSLVSDTTPELLSQDIDWLAEARGSLSAALRRDLERAFGHGEESSILGWSLLPLVIVDPSVRTSADVVSFAGRVKVADLVLAACDDGDPGDMGALAERYFAGETDVREALVASAPASHRASVERLTRDPDSELRAMRRVLRAWQERFVAVEPRVAAMAERDVAARRPSVDRLALTDLIEQATNGVRWVPDAGIRRVYLTPSYFARPYNYTFDGDGWHMFAYPLADDALDGDPAGVPPATIRLFRALGDESRMRILRYLADGDLYLTEIAERMGLSKPTVKHHLALLRAAGLVTLTETGSLTYYSLRRERLADAGTELGRYLGGPTA
jgi:DNA-binding transcriptional ArsR family regulator